jgi:hypothetical protein
MRHAPHAPMSSCPHVLSNEKGAEGNPLLRLCAFAPSRSCAPALLRFAPHGLKPVGYLTASFFTLETSAVALT